METKFKKHQILKIVTQPPPSAYLICCRRPPQRTFTFTAPNRSQQTNEPETMPHENHKNRKKRTKMAVAQRRKRKQAFIRKKSQGNFCHLENLLGAPSSTLILKTQPT